MPHPCTRPTVGAGKVEAFIVIRHVRSSQIVVGYTIYILFITVITSLSIIIRPT